MRYPERDEQLNAAAQLRFVQECARSAPGIRIVYAGTRQIYGKPQYLPVDEKHPVNPIDINGIHKYSAIMYHLLCARDGDSGRGDSEPHQRLRSPDGAGRALPGLSEHVYPSPPAGPASRDVRRWHATERPLVCRRRGGGVSAGGRRSQSVLAGLQRGRSHSSRTAADC